MVWSSSPLSLQRAFGEEVPPNDFAFGWHKDSQLQGRVHRQLAVGRDSHVQEARSRQEVSCLAYRFGARLLQLDEVPCRRCWASLELRFQPQNPHCWDTLGWDPRHQKSQFEGPSSTFICYCAYIFLFNSTNSVNFPVLLKCWADRFVGAKRCCWELLQSLQSSCWRNADANQLRGFSYPARVIVWWHMYHTYNNF